MPKETQHKVKHDIFLSVNFHLEPHEPFMSSGLRVEALVSQCIKY